MAPRIPITSFRRTPLSSAYLLRTLQLSRPARNLASTSSSSSSSHGHDEVHHESHHEEPYDEPGGWYLGVPPGEVRKDEGWEKLMWYGFFGGLAACIVAMAYKPDTSIQTWALEEARRRLEKEGLIQGPSTQTANAMWIIQNAIAKAQAGTSDDDGEEQREISDAEADEKIVQVLKEAIRSLESEEDDDPVDDDFKRRRDYVLKEARSIVQKGGVFGSSGSKESN